MIFSFAQRRKDAKKNLFENIEHPQQTLQKQHKLIDRLCGALADDPSLIQIFEEIEQQRNWQNRNPNYENFT